jgi:hypothetical protein
LNGAPTLLRNPAILCYTRVLLPWTVCPRWPNLSKEVRGVTYVQRRYRNR